MKVLVWWCSILLWSGGTYDNGGGVIAVARPAKVATTSAFERFDFSRATSSRRSALSTQQHNDAESIIRKDSNELKNEMMNIRPSREQQQQQQQRQRQRHRSLQSNDDDGELIEEQVESDEEPSSGPLATCDGCDDGDNSAGLPGATPTVAPSARTQQPSIIHDEGDDHHPHQPQPTAPPLEWRQYTNSGIDFLVAAFFFIAAGWLILALLYSILVLIVVRLRARGELDIYDEHFGRLYLIGRHCYIPLGCILRRYVVALSEEETSSPVRIMTREERRVAMEELLGRDPSEMQAAAASDGEESGDGEENDSPEGRTEDESIQKSSETSPETVPSSTSEESAPPSPQACAACGATATSSEEEAKEEKEEEQEGEGEEPRPENPATDLWLENNEPVCSICLMEYEEGEEDDVFHSNVCRHEFHKACLLDWLERRNNTECPICRTALVSDEEVWETVQRRRKQYRDSNRTNYCCLLLCCCCGDGSTAVHNADRLDDDDDDYSVDIEMGDQNEIIDPSVLIAADPPTRHHASTTRSEAIAGVEQQREEEVPLTHSNNDALDGVENTTDSDQQKVSSSKENTNGQPTTSEEK